MIYLKYIIAISWDIMGYIYIARIIGYDLDVIGSLPPHSMANAMGNMDFISHDIFSNRAA